MGMALENRRDVWDKISSEYQNEIISPLTHAEVNPLWADLKKILTRDHTIADIGCGTGTLAKIILESFACKHIHAIDFSSGMLNEAKKRIGNSEAPITYLQSSMSDLKRHELKFDLTLSVNSLIMPNILKIEKSLEAIHASTKKGGDFIAILPSLESIQEEYQYTYQKEFKRLRSATLAEASTKKKLEAHRINFGLGLYHTDDMLQKYYNSNEIKLLLTDAGFKNLKINRVIYQKGHSFNYGDESLRGHPRMWDWYVKAKV